MKRRTMAFAAVVAALTAVTMNWSSAANAQSQTGTVNLNVTRAGFIVGIGGGSGTLNFRGRTYRLALGGISAGTIGVSGAQLVGTAENLRSASDIAGTYTAVSAGLAVTGGARSAVLQNARGVILRVRGQQVGFEASLSLSGLTIRLQ